MPPLDLVIEIHLANHTQLGKDQGTRPPPSPHQEGRPLTFNIPLCCGGSIQLARQEACARTNSLPNDTDAYAVSMTYGTVQPCVRHREACRLLSYLDKIPRDHCSPPSLYSATPGCGVLVANPLTIGHIPAIMVAQDVRHLCFRKADTENLAII